MTWRSWACVISLASMLLVLAPLHLAEARDQRERIEFAGDVFEKLLPVSILSWSLVAQDFRGAGRFTLAFGLTMGMTWTLKGLIDAERPNGAPHAMPSGHTAAAFSAASFAQRRYGWAFGLPYYTAAMYTGWSRIESNNHYWRDVGVATGIAIGTTLLTVPRLEGRIKLFPYGDHNGSYGLRLQRDF